tara:strand:- start:64296 stop:67481 length:3186 start_codon:yes stop_codon:yes gene_type:complete
MQRFLLLLISSLFLTNFGNTQTHNFLNYNVENGLEQADILSINQTKNGFLLFGSNGGGLGIFNGYEFKSFKEKQGLANNVVFSVSIDLNEQIWCATNSGISRINKNLTLVEKNYLKDIPFYVSYSYQNTNYFGSAAGLYIYNQQTDSIIKKNFSHEVLDKAWITTIFIDSQKNIWIGTQKDGVFKVEESNKITQFSKENSNLRNNYIKAIIEGKDKDVFIGTIDGLYLIKNNNLTDLEIPSVDGLFLTFTSAVIHNNHLVLGALNTRLYFVNLDNYSFSLFAPENGFDYKRVWCIFNDKENNLWLGTIGSGLVKYIPNFSYYNQHSGLLNNYINAVYLHDNKIYVANRLALQIIEKNKVTNTLVFDERNQFNYIYHIISIENTIYLGTNKGLFKLKDNKFLPTINIAEINVINEDIYTSYQSKNNIYFGGKSGLYQFKNDTLSSIKNAPKASVYNITEYKKQLYIASENGIYKLSDNNYEFIGSGQRLNCTRARSFVTDNELLWVGTNDGVYIYDGNKVVFKLSNEQHLSSENIYFLKKDKNNNIWTGTNKGVDKIAIKSVYEALSDSTKTPEIKSYSKNKGFNGVECNLNAVEVLNNNELLFGTIDGLFIYNKKDDLKNELPPILSLNNIKLNFVDVDWSVFGEVENKLPKNLSLTYVNNNLIFEYVGVSLTNPEQVVYQYKLEGLDNNWLPATTDQKAVYTAIPPGDYTFMLKAKNADSVWIEEPLTFSFSITPPWWQTTWFYVIAVIAILLSFYFIMDYRTKKLKKEQQVLTQKVDERTKELREEKEKVEQVNSKLETQKKIIEVANKNITDSINYAKKIQEAILPKATKLEKIIDFISILFVPKDVVSGDFYWFEKMGKKIILAAADCTGHGVPGAFMSMIGINNLNQIVLENKTTQPDIILKELNNSIKKALKQDDKDSESKDGMDIALTCIDYETNTLTYSGAFRPLVYIRNNKLFELKGSRQPIGGSAPNDFAYDLHTIPLQKGDVFYLFSDGYPDQFGGPKGKKLMNKNLKDKFLAIHQESPAKQKEILLNDFNTWKGNNEQIDDILIIVIKI